jgi:hypothetical protein
MAITLRSEKGSNLTANEVDDNFLTLSGSIAELEAGGGSGGGVSYTSYVAKISGDSPVTSSVFENTTGLTFTWTSGSYYGSAYAYTTTISSVDPTKIALFTSGEVSIIEFKGTEVVFPRPGYKITTVNSTTATLDVWYDTSTMYAPGTPVMVDVRIYP